MAVTQKKRPAAAHLRVNGVAPGTAGPPGVTLVGSCKFPGLAGTSKLYESYDAYLRPFALLGFAASNQYTVVLESVSDEHRGVGPEQFDAWLEMWDQSIGALSAKVELAAAAVTLDAVVIDGGETVEAIPRWAAETGAFDWLFADREPEGSGRVPLRLRARIALTFSAPGGRGRGRGNAEEMATEIGRRLPGLSAGLQLTENGPARPLDAEELAEAVRVAYDPSIAGLLAQARREGGSGIRWEQAGPVDSSSEWDHYRHDGAYSVTWAMSRVSGGDFFPSVLARWLIPDEEIIEKRATLLYGPPAPEPAPEPDDDGAGRGLRRARRPAAGPNPWLSDEPRITRYGILATATVGSLESLPATRYVVHELGPRERVLLRRVYGSQASAFVAALPLGVVAPDRLTLPQANRPATAKRRRRGGS
ncbi:SCO6880 family protein [Uniformispora flossi]|uniref:SCO6880 family protein n=1 Tax=Uniformispora flossi TaxID=3390723 RepID=UPI003C2FAF53